MSLAIWPSRPAGHGRAFIDRARTVSGEAWRKALLVCGIASSLLYALMIWRIRYEGYNPASQVPSELTAIGMPTRALWMRLGWIYTLLVAAFGWGIWRSARRNRAVQIVGGLILAYASLGLLWPFAAMHQREVLAAGGGTLSDTMHVVLGGVTVLLMFLAIGVAAAALGKRFRLYSIASVVVLLAFGVLTFLEAPRLQANLPTPWIGLWERINISVFLLWVAVLATMLWRTGAGPRRSGARGARDLPQLCRRTPFRPRCRYRPSSHRSVSIRLSRVEHAAERDTSRPGRRACRSARCARHQPRPSACLP